MSTEHPREPMTEVELRAFAEKLDAWSQELPQKERWFLEGILRWAATAESGEVDGYLMASPAASTPSKVTDLVRTVGQLQVERQQSSFKQRG